MIHLTLNTGHSRFSPRGEVSGEAVEFCRGLLPPGIHEIPTPGGEGYMLTVPGGAPGTWMGTLNAPGRRPMVTFGVASSDADAGELWAVLERHYLSLTDKRPFASAGFVAPKRPESTPWCAAVLILMSLEEAEWVGDLERCVAWAFLESTP